MDTDDSKPWNVSWEESHEAPYMHKGIKWVSFDNQESIRIKTNYAYQHNLAGVMTWSIDTDDFKGKLELSFNFRWGNYSFISFQVNVVVPLSHY